VNLGSLNLRLKNQNHKKGCEYHELMKGHDAMIIVPMELAQMLDSIGIKEHKRRDIATNGNCCWNHIVVLPKKNGIEYPLFDYEKLLYKALLELSYLNSNPKLHTQDPGNIIYPFKKHLYR
jgi:hypothetical protein